jgi:hypothetical protein
MSLREKMTALFSGPLVEEQRKLMGLGPSLPSLEEAKGRSTPLKVQEAVDMEAVDPPDAEVDPDTEHGIHLSSKAHELSDLAHQAHGWNPPLHPSYVGQLHFRAHDAHDEAHAHWQHVAQHHEDPNTREVAADIAGEHDDARKAHHLAISKIKDKEPESQKAPEVYHASRSKRVA